MLSYKSFLIEMPIDASVTDEIEQHLRKLKQDIKLDYGCNFNKRCLDGMGLEVSRIVKNEIEQQFNLYSKIIYGNYLGADEDYTPNLEDWDEKEIELYYKMYKRNKTNANGLPFGHYWIEIQNFIIDLTEDQFHEDKDYYEVSIYKKPMKIYQTVKTIRI